ncbi:MAG: hypothetical protein IKS90_02735 [Clostridia bacterium]|nr:hypothetical protein [Clostridia bacterium]
MTHAEFLALAREYGFEKVYFLPLDRYDLGSNPHRLVADAALDFPFASCVAALVFPYAPFTASERIPAYYLASNRAYHARKALIDRLRDAGLTVEKAEIPVRTALNRARVGAALRTGFISIEPFGTRIVLECLAVSDLTPLEYSESPAVPCRNCGACIKACPAGAIGEKGVDYEKCFRAFMETAAHPDRIRDAQTTYIGCEVCQYCCRANSHLEKSEPANDVKQAFDTRRLILGDTKQARSLVGKNMTSGGKLTAEAIAFAARDGEYCKEILAQSDSPFDAVRDAVRYANERYKTL